MGFGFWNFEDPRTPATWTNGKKTIKGYYLYVWQSDRFIIDLNSTDRITGEKRRIVTSNDSPEWGNWKLVRSKL